MKTSHKVFRAAALLLVLMPIMAAQNVSAQEPTIGYLDPDPFIPAMPEYAAIQQQLKQLQQTNQQAIQTRADAFQAKLAEYQKLQPELSAESRATREQELTQLQGELQAFAAQKERELGAKRAELLNPLANRIQDAIDAVGSEKNLDMVMRLPVLLYANDSKVVDITVEVARKLGLPTEPESEE